MNKPLTLPLTALLLSLAWQGPLRAEITLDQLAYAGHGKLFGSKLEDLKLDESQLKLLQDAMLNEVLKADIQPPKDKLEAIAKAQQWLESKELEFAEAAALKSGVVGAFLLGAPEKLVLRLGWRNHALIGFYWNLKPKLKLRPELIEILKELGFFDPPSDGSKYIADCRAHRVPIPPDWAESGTDWQYQGTLSRNLLSPGDYAAVWTYSDPLQRGACIALPRGDGDPGAPAGIICQSASTGHACFWDNILDDGGPEQFIGWRGQRLEIARLKNGANLNSACTGCHRGTNVYLISPDDPTWGKVLRGPLSGPRTGTFTTKVEWSSDYRYMHYRYIPISTLPERPGWQNTYLPEPGCAGACHEPPSAPGTPPMPPACASPLPENCYGTP